MTDVMKAQVGGSHYSSMGMQPFEFTMANRYDPLVHTILKYVARHVSKNGKVDLEKAKHCVRMRVAMLEDNQPKSVAFFSILHFCLINKLPELETLILKNLQYWTLGCLGTTRKGQENYPIYDAIIELIDELIDLRYPDKER